MIKWLLRLAILALLFLVGSYYLKVNVADGKLIIEPRPIVERVKFWRALQPLLPKDLPATKPVPTKAQTATPPAEKQAAKKPKAESGKAKEEMSHRERQALDQLLETTE